MRQRLGCIVVLAGFAMVRAALAAPGDPPSAGAPTATADRIKMESYSWGRLLWRWTINADGSGEFTSAAPKSNDNRSGAVTRHWNPSPSRYEKMVELLSPLEPYAGKKLPCVQAISDLPYGNLTWTHGGSDRVVSFDLGCRSTEADKLYDDMGATFSLVSQWAASAPVDSEPQIGSRAKSEP